MFTIFSTPKPFRGHVGVIQRNALKSWTLLHPDVEIILFGDDEGTADVCRELGLRHEPYVERGNSGLKRIDYMFGKAQAIARHDVLCHVNCDIILMDDFTRSVQLVKSEYSRFLMVGRRWDTPITHSVDFADSGWNEKVRSAARSANDQRDWWWIDYFVFSRGFYDNEMPPFVIGTVRWDNWLLWKALDLQLPVVDASQAVLAVHQNHDYSYHLDGKKGVWEGQESQQNLKLAGGWDHMRNISHATREITPGGRIRSTWLRRKRLEMRQFSKNPMSNTWYSLLRLSFAARRALGLNREGIGQIRARFGPGRNLE
jgi:hypothetical protein